MMMVWPFSLCSSSINRPLIGLIRAIRLLFEGYSSRGSRALDKRGVVDGRVRLQVCCSWDAGKDNLCKVAGMCYV